ncbi:MAG: hypothetical protein WC712_06945 [Candidatus Brocadiia bacterium]
MAPIVEKVLKTKHGTLTLSASGLRLEHGSQGKPQYISMPIESVDSCKIAMKPYEPLLIFGIFLIVPAIILILLDQITLAFAVIFVQLLMLLIQFRTMRPVLYIKAHGRQQIVADIPGSDFETLKDFANAVDAAKLAFLTKAQPPENPPLA